MPAACPRRAERATNGPPLRSRVQGTHFETAVVRAVGRELGFWQRSGFHQCGPKGDGIVSGGHHEAVLASGLRVVRIVFHLVEIQTAMRSAIPRPVQISCPLPEAMVSMCRRRRVARRARGGQYPCSVLIQSAADIQSSAKYVIGRSRASQRMRPRFGHLPSSRGTRLVRSCKNVSKSALPPRVPFPPQRCAASPYPSCREHAVHLMPWSPAHRRSSGERIHGPLLAGTPHSFGNAIRIPAK